MARPEIKNITVSQSDTPKIDIGDLDYDVAIKWLTRKRDEQERIVSFMDEFVGAHPLDALVAYRNALADIYGWVDDVPAPGWFGLEPPTMVPVTIGVGKVTHVPMGLVQIPGLSGELNSQIHVGDSIAEFILNGDFKKKDIPKLEEISQRTRHFLATKSIYKGQALKVSFEWLRRGRRYDINLDSPKFLDLSKVKPSDLVLAKDSQEQFQIGLLNPLVHYEQCRRFNIPLKRGVLFAGKPGVGKTLATMVGSLVATQNGWTVFYMESVLDLPQTLKLASHYQRAVVIGEDFDRIGGGERTGFHDLLINALDGFDNKSTEIITVLTTNDVKAILPVLLRRGRIDNLVIIDAPDAPAAVTLVQKYGEGLLAPSTDYQLIGEKLAGVYPAAIRGAVEDAKLASIGRMNGGKEPGLIDHEDLLYAAKQANGHNQLVNRKMVAKPKHIELHISVPPAGGEVITANSAAEMKDYDPTYDRADEDAVISTDEGD